MNSNPYSPPWSGSSDPSRSMWNQFDLRSSTRRLTCSDVVTLDSVSSSIPAVGFSPSCRNTLKRGLWWYPDLPECTCWPHADTRAARDLPRCVGLSTDSDVTLPQRSDSTVGGGMP